MASRKTAYGSSSALTITLASLASSATFVFGRESTLVDNTSDLYLDYGLAGKVTTGTSPTNAKEIRIYLVGLMEDSTWPDVFDGTDSDETVTSVGILNSCTRLAASIITDGTSNRTYPLSVVSVKRAFLGFLPKKFSAFVTHSTAVNLNSTGSNHAIYVTPIYETIA